MPPIDLYRYFEKLLELKFEQDSEDIKAGYQPGHMKYFTANFFWKCFEDKQLALKHLAGILKTAKSLYS